MMDAHGSPPLSGQEQANNGKSKVHMLPLTQRLGRQLTEGSGRILVTAVGEDSEWGRTMAMVMGQSGETPLQETLARLAANIGKVGLAVGVLCFVVLMVRCGPQQCQDLLAPDFGPACARCSSFVCPVWSGLGLGQILMGTEKVGCCVCCVAWSGLHSSD